MRVDTFCAATCSLTLSEEVAKQFVSKIEDDYRVNMILDAHDFFFRRKG